MFKSARFVLFFCFLALTALAQTTPFAPRIQVTGGTIEGSSLPGGKVQVFKGIPFAAPPTGAGRWKAPQAVVPWEGVRNCTAFGASPMQGNPQPFLYWSTPFLIPAAPISEDCLYLNVWTGAENEAEKRPVIVYIYGGGFMSGGAGCPIYDGTAMAQKGVVFVSINYRVGVFGFLAHPELSAETTRKTSGNYALMDMIAALNWVQNNIQAFGGDPQNVTIAGQSAGAFAVNYLCVAPPAKGLFHRGIAQSGGNFYEIPGFETDNLASAEQKGLEFSQSLACTTIAELRAKPAAEIMRGPGGNTRPIIDGYLIPDQVATIYAKAQQHDVPLLLGWNADDLVMPRTPVKADAFKAQIEMFLGEAVPAFLAAYPAATDAEATKANFDMNRDLVFGAQVYAWAKHQKKTGQSSVFLYNFNRKLPSTTAEEEFGAFHSSEIVYAYNNLHTIDRPWTRNDHKLADQMSDYWVNFAKTGNPNGKQLPVWPAYESTQEQVMVLDKKSRAAPLPTQKQLRFWEKIFEKK